MQFHALTDAVQRSKEEGQGKKRKKWVRRTKQTKDLMSLKSALRRDPVTGQPFAPPTLKACKELAQDSECNAGFSSLSSSLEVGEWPSKAALGDSLAETSEHLRALLRSFRETFAPRTDCANPAVE